MSQSIIKSEKSDHSLLYHEFRWAVAWGWSIIGFFSIISAFTSQEEVSLWQINYSISLLVAILSSFYFHRKFNTALSYVPVPLVLWFSPFFITDPDQKPWISIGFIAGFNIELSTFYCGRKFGYFKRCQQLAKCFVHKRCFGKYYDRTTDKFQ